MCDEIKTSKVEVVAAISKQTADLNNTHTMCIAFAP